MKWTHVIGFLTVLMALLGIGIQLYGIKTQLDSQKKIASAEYVLKLRDELNGDKYVAITTAIEDHPYTYPLFKNGFSTSSASDYIGMFETISYLVRDNVMTSEMAYSEFSYDVEKAYCNQDVRALIEIDRQGDTLTGPDAFWAGFQFLAMQFLNKDHYTCTSTALN